MNTSHEMTSNKPYLLDAMYRWICDNDCTPYLYINTAIEGVRVPNHLLQDNPLILNTSPQSCVDFHIGKNSVSFQTRFSGEVFSVYLPMQAVIAIMARENGEGMHFGWEEESAATDSDNADSTAHDTDASTETTSKKSGTSAKKSTGTKKKSGLKIVR